MIQKTNIDIKNKKHNEENRNYFIEQTLNHQIIKTWNNGLLVYFYHQQKQFLIEVKIPLLR